MIFYRRDYRLVFEIFSGENLIDAQPRLDNQSNQPIVSFTLDRLGSQRFGKITSNNIGKRIAIVLDNKLISAPQIRESITGGSGIISGNFTFSFSLCCLEIFCG